MLEGPNIATLGALIGDPARANVLAALLSGKALTATELAFEAGVTNQTASSHLAKLQDASLVQSQKQGRHKYFSLAGEDVANMLETMMGFAEKYGHVRVKTGPKDLILRHSRACYNHLAGEMGVRLWDSLMTRQYLAADQKQLTLAGEAFFDDFMPDWRNLCATKRPLCKACLDWSARRSHLAGSLGTAVLEHLYRLDWARRIKGSRAIVFTVLGEQKFHARFPLS